MTSISSEKKNVLNNVNLKEYEKRTLNIQNNFYEILTNIWCQD